MSLKVSKNNFEYKEININDHIRFLSEQIKTFRNEKIEELEYKIARLLKTYLKHDDLNNALMKVFQSFIPDDIKVFNSNRVQFIATALNKVRDRYES